MSTEIKAKTNSIILQLLFGGCLVAERELLFAEDEGIHIGRFHVMGERSISYDKPEFIPENRVLSMDLQAFSRPAGYIASRYVTSEPTYYLPGTAPLNKTCRTTRLSDIMALKQFAWVPLVNPSEVIPEAQEFWRCFISR